MIEMFVFGNNLARGVHLLWLLVVAYFGCQILGLQEQGLNNEHVRVVFKPGWPPFIDYSCSNATNWEWGTDCPNGTDIIYSGILWDFLMLMKQHKNVSYTYINSVNDDGFWGGTCYDSNNCTGMIGTVNRDEADLALGLMK